MTWTFQPYVRASFEQHLPKRARRLLLHRREIDRLLGLTQIKGHTLVALRLYWKEARVKIEIGVAKGKEAFDKRQDLKERAAKRETDREVARSTNATPNRPAATSPLWAGQPFPGRESPNSDRRAPARCGR